MTIGGNCARQEMFHKKDISHLDSKIKKLEQEKIQLQNQVVELNNQTADNLSIIELFKKISNKIDHLLDENKRLQDQINDMKSTHYLLYPTNASDQIIKYQIIDALLKTQISHEFKSISIMLDEFPVLILKVKLNNPNIDSIAVVDFLNQIIKREFPEFSGFKIIYKGS